MIPAVIGLGELSLRIDTPPKFAAPKDQGILQEAAFLQLPDQGGPWLVDVITLATDMSGQIAMLIPATVIELDESYTSLGETSCENAICRIAAGLARFGAVTFEDGCGLF